MSLGRGYAHKILVRRYARLISGRNLNVNMKMKEIYFAGGCFWVTEKVFKSCPGVKGTTVGYANGHTENPTYHEVCTDTTGHRETVKVEYDPKEISLGK